MNEYKLKMNAFKTEVLYLSSKRLVSGYSQHPISIDGHLVQPSSTVRNLGVMFDRYLDMEAHVSSMCRSAYLQLRRLYALRRYMDKTSLECLVHAFVSSRLDYGNALLCGISQCQLRRLQLVQNSAARLLTRTSRSEHITPILRNLHWLPVKARITFKVLLLAFKCVHNRAPFYLCETVDFYQPNLPLRSADMFLLNVPFTLSNRCQNSAFSYVAPNLWNALPLCIRCTSSLNAFKSMLKTFLLPSTTVNSSLFYTSVLISLFYSFFLMFLLKLLFSYPVSV
jgi:hypothetical protein